MLRDPRRRHDIADILPCRFVQAVGIVRRLHHPRVPVDKDQGGYPLRIACRIEDARRNSAAERDQRRALRPGSLQHHANVVHPQLEARNFVERDGVGEPAPALVEADQPAETREPLEESRELWRLPLSLDRVPELGHEQEVARARTAQHLVGDVHIAIARVARVGSHTRSFVPSKTAVNAICTAHPTPAVSPVLGDTIDVTDPDARAIPETRYARSGDVHIAYQVVGHGPLDLVATPGGSHHVELVWENPPQARFFSRLASISRMILFDKRGTGMSDRVSGAPTLEARMDDIRAVMDAAGSERAVLWGPGDAGPLCMLFAATYPERTLGLVPFNSGPRFTRNP
jgi:hypothetical protein